MAETEIEVDTIFDRHLKFGWWCLFGFILLGLVLDAFHAFKVPWYLNVGNETRRLMGTLAHAHGTLFGGLNLAFAFTWQKKREQMSGIVGLASSCLMSASLLIPTGFLLAGLFTVKGEPGFGVFLVPIGGILLIIAVGLTAKSMMGKSSGEVASSTGKKANAKKQA